MHPLQQAEQADALHAVEVTHTELHAHVQDQRRATTCGASPYITVQAGHHSLTLLPTSFQELQTRCTTEPKTYYIQAQSFHATAW